MTPKINIIYKREIYLVIAIYIFILLPLVLGLVYLSLKMDDFFRFPKIIILNGLFNAVFSLALILTGIFILWWTYTYLVIAGEGSPSPMLKQTKKLVTCGPYSIVRHPSIIGKTIIVLGTGIIFQSFSFIFIMIPLMLCYACFERVREEKKLLELWPLEYREYKKRVPFLLPVKKSLFMLFKHNR